MEGQTQSRVQRIRRFFEAPQNNITRVPSRPSFNNQNIRAEIPTLPVELPDNSSESIVCDIPIAAIHDQYFAQAPMNTWVICLELKKALFHGAKESYKKRLFGLLERQFQKMNELNTLVHQLEEHLKSFSTTSFTQNETVDSDFVSLFSQNLSEGFSNLLNTLSENSMLNESHTSDDKAYSNHLTQREVSSFKEDRLKLREYPTEWIQIISDFLSLIQEEGYQNFLEQWMLNNDPQFKSRNHPPVIQYAYQQAGAHQLPYLSQEEVYAQFVKQNTRSLKRKVVALNTEFMVKLNAEFRAMLKLSLHGLLLSLQVDLFHHPLWSLKHPLASVDKQWIIHHEGFLKHYLMRIDSESNYKTIPIQYPIYTKYTVKEMTLNQKGTTTKEFEQEKIYDAARWIARIKRCDLAALQDIIPDQNDREKVFASCKHFINWLQNDSSVSFSYVREEDQYNNPLSHPQKLIFTIQLSDIAPVNPLYFEDLKHKALYCSTHTVHEFKP